MNKKISSLLGDTWEAALNFIYPPVCQICEEERAGVKDGYVGGKCRSKIQFVKAPFCERCGLPYPGSISHAFECENCREFDYHFRFARSAVVVNSVMTAIIHRYKYKRQLCFEPLLADLLNREAVPPLQQEKWDLIVPVPLYPAKEREREFNQAERLARHLSRASHIPVNTKLIRRVRPTESQTRLNRSERAGNMHDAFAPGRKAKLAGERIIVLDDVLTTGATTSACARILRQAGAGDVCVWTLARGA